MLSSILFRMAFCAVAIRCGSLLRSVSRTAASYNNFQSCLARTGCGAELISGILAVMVPRNRPAGNSSKVADVYF